MALQDKFKQTLEKAKEQATEGLNKTQKAVQEKAAPAVETAAPVVLPVAGAVAAGAVIVGAVIKARRRWNGKKSDRG